MTTTTKLPTDSRALIRDPELAAAIEKLLRPYSGERLERAQAAVRAVRSGPAQGTFHELVATYGAAIQKAAGKSD